MADTANINLLKQKNNSNLDTVLRFAVNGGRFIVLFTETIALAAFLYRFTLDRQIIDLRDQIEAKQTIVRQLEPLEKTYRGIQDRIQQAKTLDDNALLLPQLFDEVIKNGDGVVTFTSLYIATDTIRIEADVTSVSGLDTFVSSLKNNALIENVSIDNIENRTSSALISFSLSAKIKGQTPSPTPPPGVQTAPNEGEAQ